MLANPPESKLQPSLKLESKEQTAVTMERGVQAQKCRNEFPSSSFPSFLISSLSCCSSSSSSLSLAVFSPPTAAAFSPNGQRAAVGTASGTVYLLDLRTWQVRHTGRGGIYLQKSLMSCPEARGKPNPPVITLFDSALYLNTARNTGLRTLSLPTRWSVLLKNKAYKVKKEPKHSHVA